MTQPASEILVSQDGKQLGPYSAKQIHAKLLQGKLRSDDLAWREGLPDWKPLAEVMHELGYELSPPPPLPDQEQLRSIPISLSDGKTDLIDSAVDLPERGIYEPEATLSQKNKLMKLGMQNPGALRHIGRDQASFLIDQVLVTYAEGYRRKRNRQTLATLAVLCSIAVVAAIIYFVSKSTGTADKDALANPRPSASLSTTSEGISSKAVLITDVSVNLKYGTTLVRRGTLVTIVSRVGDSLTARDPTGLEFIIPASAIGR